MAPEVKKIFEMSPEAATVPFGFASESSFPPPVRVAGR